MQGNINAQNLARALGPVAACTAPCTPFNIFGGAGIDHPSDARLCRLHPARQQPAEIVGFLGEPDRRAVRSAGRRRQHRHRRPASRSFGRFDPDPIVAAGLGSDIPALPTSGGYDVNEAFAELRLPLLRDTAFFHRLELTGAARYSDYSTSGSTTTFSAGINWQPIEDLLFRGSWAEGFRAPSIGEIVRHAVALRPGSLRSLLAGLDRGAELPERRDSARQLHRRRRPRQRLLHAVERAAPGDHRRQSISSIRKARKAGASAWSGGRASCRACRSRPIITTSGSTARSRRSTPRMLLGRCAQTGRARELRGDRPFGLRPGHPDPRPAPEYRQHRDRRARSDLELPHRGPARPAPSACSGPTASCSTTRSPCRPPTASP